jgi:beta-phosphoglucomutase-like phosphatase (HAD superfamily)
MFDKPVEAVIFDMDGLLIDTEAVYIKAYMAGAAIMGVEMPLAFCHSMIGTPSPECDRMIQEFFGPAFRLDDFNGHVDSHAAQLLEAGVPVKPGAADLLTFLGKRGLPLAVATSSSRRTTERHLGRAGLLGHFRALATRDDVYAASPIPTFISKPPAGSASRLSDASPSRIPTPASPRPMPPARWRSWCPTSCRRPRKCGRSA